MGRIGDAGAGSGGVSGASSGGGASSGSASGSDGGGVSPVICTASVTTPGRAPLRRLTAAQLNNALQDILGDPSFPVQATPPETSIDGFYNNADVQTPTAALVEDYATAAEAASAEAVAKVSTLAGCAATDAGCGATFIQNFGALAFRRPLTSDEQSRYLAFYDQELQGTDEAVALRLVAYAMLQSPQFLYVPEFGEPGATPANGAVPLSPYELATRLSLFLLDSIPDSQLLAAAAAGTLSTPDQIDTQARRLLATPRARAAIANFGEQWLDLEHLDLPSVAKDPTAFPQWNPALESAMHTEVDMFVTSNILDGDGKLSSLLTSNQTWVNGPLASIYGINPPSASGFTQVTLDPTHRAGLLTLSALLAEHAHQVQPSIVWRGVFVLDRLFCAPPPDPPANVNTAVVDTTTAMNTNRDREEAHITNASCAGCHTQIDGIGFTFEEFDALGQFRTTDNGQPVDTSGTIVGTDVDGPVTNAVDLANKLAGSAQVHTCMTKEWLRYAYARVEDQTDTCNIQLMDQAFTAGNSDIRELLVAIVKSNEFTQLAVP
jgi:hypothetical protein